MQSRQSFAKEKDERGTALTCEYIAPFSGVFSTPVSLSAGYQNEMSVGLDGVRALSCILRNYSHEKHVLPVFYTCTKFIVARGAFIQISETILL